jgi:RNA polymerase sigma-70 factor, ECF subfamily
MITAVAPATTSSAEDGLAGAIDPTTSAEFMISTAPATGRPRAGAEDRMRCLCQAHAGALLRYLTRLTLGDRQVAEDLLQETLLRAWRSLPALTADVRTLRPWLYTVARRLAIDNARTRAVRPREVKADELVNLRAAGDAMERVVLVHTVRRGLASLSAAHRQVLIELYYRGVPMAVLAKALGIPEGTVKSRVYYALRALRRTIEDADTASSPVTR